MTGLWVAAVLMSAAVALAIVMPLIRRPGGPQPGRGEYDITVYKDQLREIDRDRDRGLLGEEEAEAARVEIQRRILAAVEVTDPKQAASGGAIPRGRTAAAVLGAAIPAAAFGIYSVLGSPEMPGQPFAGRNMSSEIVAREGKLDRNEVTQLAARLLKRLEADPNNVHGWTLLGRTYLSIRNFEGALAAYRKAMEVGNRDPKIVTDYAEALVLSENGQVGPEARGLFEDIAEADPYNPRARYFLGLGLAQRGNFKAALRAWVDLRAVSPPGSPWLEMVDQRIARAAEDLQVAPWSVKPSAKALALAKAMPATEAPAPPPASSTAARPSTPPSGAPGPSAEDVKAASQMSAADRQTMIRTMVQRLADRLEENPDDLSGWQRLARAYEVLGETEKAKDARARVEALAKKGR
ncbi:MAG: c-type cytochrome biogenesis protein CcmI [Proteobacteria bacterium]|nr:c-type cytochrome biogenesis protein CcmI [Pseudomonadota bacterium]